MNGTEKRASAGKISPLAAGAAGGLGLLSAYFLILGLLNSFDHAVSQFLGMWYWIIALSAGFGAQIGLYAYIKLKRAACANTGSSLGIAATGGISAASMAGCCIHHIADIVPLVGLAWLSAAAPFVSQYQTQFMVLGAASNIAGIITMLSVMQKHNLYDKNGFFAPLLKYDMNLARNIAVVLSLLVIAASFYSAYASENTAQGAKAGAKSDANDAKIIKQITADSGKLPGLPEKISDENGASVSAKPAAFGPNAPMIFDIVLTTHTGSLDYDMEKISVLEDSEGNAYYPVSWNGSAPGGHHRRGTLAFPKLKGRPSGIKLIIKGVYGVPQRVFEWGLN